MKDYLQLNYKAEVLPWFFAQFLSIRQEANIRVVTVCNELYSAIENRLITAYVSQLLAKDEVLIILTQRGKNLCDSSIRARLVFEPKPGFDDQSLGVYLQCAIPVNIQDIIAKQCEYNALDDFLS